MAEYLYDSVGRSRSLAELTGGFQQIFKDLDRGLKYHGNDRFVAFYHEPRALEVLWRDRHSYGFATGAWIRFMDDVAPIATHYGVNVGCDGTAATHVLFIEREAGKAYFADRTHAVQFLARLAIEQPHADWASAAHTDDFDTMIEITPKEIGRMARTLWEERSRKESIPGGWADEPPHLGISIAAAIHLP